jgi:hypothetical protein
MTNNHLSFEDDSLRGKYAREIGEYFKKNNIYNWHVSPSPKKGEILIHPLDGLPENEREISRVSVQITEDGAISFGISGYNYKKGEDAKKECDSKEYNYHKKDFNKYGQPENGRWWLTKNVGNLESVVHEFKRIQHLLD